MRHDSPHLVDRLGAALVLAVVLASAGYVMASPALAKRAELTQLKQRIADFSARLKQPIRQDVRYSPDDLYAVRKDDGDAQIVLQGVLNRHIQASGMISQSLRPLQADNMGELGRAVWLEVQVNGDLQAVTDLLARLDQERPALLLRRLEIVSGQGPRPDAFLQVRMEAGHIWRQLDPVHVDASAAPVQSDETP